MIERKAVQPKQIEVRQRFRHTLMTDEEVESFIRGHFWKYAKTMPHCPHWYVVKENCRDAVEFERFVMTIRRKGYRRKYENRYYTSFDVTLDGVTYYYWTMGAPLDITIIINRALKE